VYHDESERASVATIRAPLPNLLDNFKNASKARRDLCARQAKGLSIPGQAPFERPARKPFPKERELRKAPEDDRPRLNPLSQRLLAKDQTPHLPVRIRSSERRVA
jgi:hypothetical protein